MGTKKVVIVVDDEDMLNLENASTILKDISRSHNDYLLKILTLDNIVQVIKDAIVKREKYEETWFINIPLCDQCINQECKCRNSEIRYCGEFIQEVEII